MIIEDEDLLKKFKWLSFAASFRWVFWFSPGEDGAEHKGGDEGALGGFSRVCRTWGLLLLDWVFEISPGNDEALAGAEQELFGKRPLDEKSRGYWLLGYLLVLGAPIIGDICDLL